MSFRPNTRQQLTLGGSALRLTERERRGLLGEGLRRRGFPSMDEPKLEALHGDKHSRPNTPVNVFFGVPILEKLFGYTDDELIGAFTIDARLRCASHDSPSPTSRSRTRHPPVTAVTGRARQGKGPVTRLRQGPCRDSHVRSTGSITAART